MELRAAVRVTRYARAWAAFLALMSGFIVGPVAVGMVHSGLGVVPGLVLGVAGLVSLVQGFRRTTRRLVATSEALTLDDERIPRAAMKQAFVVPASSFARPCVTIEAKGMHVRVDVPTEAEGEALLSSLGLGIDHRAVTFYAVSPARSTSGRAGHAGMLLGALLFVLGLVAGFPWLAGVGFVAALASVAVFVPATLHVGADGVLVKGRVHTEFFAYSSLRGVRPTRRGVVLVTAEGEVALPMTSSLGLTAPEQDMRDALVQRIASGLARHADVTQAPSSPTADVGPRLARGSRSFAEWVLALRRDDGDFRTAPLRTEDLVRVVEDPAPVPAAQRVAAALALVQRGTEADRDRVRVAAEAVAAPKLRVALETIARDADEAALEQAVREAEDEALAEEARGAP